MIQLFITEFILLTTGMVLLCSIPYKQIAEEKPIGKDISMVPHESIIVLGKVIKLSSN